VNIWLDESPPEGDFIWLMRSEDVIEVLKTNLCDKLSIGKLTDNAAYDTLLWIEEQAYKGNRACVPNDIKIHAGFKCCICVSASLIGKVVLVSLT
jgi:hypothetical protein